MTDTASGKQERPRFQETGTQNYLPDGRSAWSWLTTLDHKRIALLYTGTLAFFFFIGAIGAALVRLELVTPAGDLLTDDGYNKMFTLHGIVMVWFFLVPAVPTTLGNFVLPLQLGAPDLAFPRLNLFSWYLFITSGAIALFALLVGGVGIANAVATFIDKRRKVIATMKSVGATSRMVLGIFLTQVPVVAVLGILIGLAAGIALPAALNFFYGDMLPIHAVMTVSAVSLVSAVIYGFAVALLFTLWPLGRVERVSSRVLFPA